MQKCKLLRNSVTYRIISPVSQKSRNVLYHCGNAAFTAAAFDAAETCHLHALLSLILVPMIM